jgi:hypothetical protein
MPNAPTRPAAQVPTQDDPPTPPEPPSENGVPFRLATIDKADAIGYDIPLEVLPKPVRAASAAQKDRSKHIDERLLTVTIGNARVFPLQGKETVRGMKLRLSKRLTALKLNGVLTVESVEHNGKPIVYAKFKDGVTGYPATLPTPETADTSAAS